MSVIDLEKLICNNFTFETLLDILRKKICHNNVQVKKIIFGPSSKKGDSYLSNVYRFVVEAFTENIQFSLPIIIKTLHSNLGRRKTFRSVDFFQNEIIFYEKVWPALKNFQNAKNIEEKFINIPTVLSSYIDESNSYIAMEDLSVKGFAGFQRHKGLDYKNTLMVLNLFAKFHGLSLAFKDQKPEEFEKAATALKEVYFAEKFRKWYNNFQKTLFIIVQDSLEKELPKQYLEKFNKIISNDFFGKVCELCCLRGPLSVITHGDAWLPNFLFKQSPSEEIVMIDFQLARYTSLSNDIIFLLYSCTDPDNLQEKWNDYLMEYHKSLCNTLKKFGSNENLIDFQTFKDDIKVCMPFGIAMSIEALTMSLLDEEDISDLDAIQGNDGVPLETVWIVHPFKEQEKRKRIATVIKHAVDQGLI